MVSRSSDDFQQGAYCTCISQPVPFNGHPTTHEHLTSLKNKLQHEQTRNFFGNVHYLVH